MSIHARNWGTVFQFMVSYYTDWATARETVYISRTDKSLLSSYHKWSTKELNRGITLENSSCDFIRMLYHLYTQFTVMRTCIKLSLNNLQLLPFCITCIIQEMCHCWKYLWNTSFGMSARPVTSCCIFSMDAKWWPLFSIFLLAKGQKSHKVRPGEYRRWRIAWICFFTTNCHNAREMWQGTLPWCRIQQFFTFLSNSVEWYPSLRTSI